jgi:tetratricopeptide (TPR) repeat protein
VTSQPQILLEDRASLSQSRIWQMQRDYYQQQGASAWADQVPFNVTSNPFIANTYANLILAYIRDWLTQHPQAIQHPFYILELGAGHGRFGFYTIKRLCELIQQSEISAVKIRYLMSDLARRNFDYWMTHAELKPFVENNVLDFALYDVAQDDGIRLIRSNSILTANQLQNPLVVIANYLFDSIPQDCFRVENEKLFAGLVSTSTEEGNLVDGEVKKLDQLLLNYNYEPVGNNFYQETDIDQILFDYKNSISEGTFVFPIIALRAIKRLLQLSNQKMLLISSDKGHVAAEDLAKSDVPHFAHHYSVSMMVNFHAIAEFFKLHNGNYFMQMPRRGIKTILYYAGFSLDEMPHLRMATNEHLERMCPADYFALYTSIRDNYQHYTMDSLVAALNMSYWDPQLFKNISNHLCEQLDSIDLVTVEYLEKNIDHIANNFYYLPNTRDIFLDIGIFLHKIKQWQRAIAYYLRSQHFFGEQFGAFYNLGLCYFEIGDLRESMCCFRRAWELQPLSQEAGQWLQYIEKMRAESVSST